MNHVRRSSRFTTVDDCFVCCSTTTTVFKACHLALGAFIACFLHVWYLYPVHTWSLMSTPTKGILCGAWLGNLSDIELKRRRLTVFVKHDCMSPRVPLVYMIITLPAMYPGDLQGATWQKFMLSLLLPDKNTCILRKNGDRSPPPNPTLTDTLGVVDLSCMRACTSSRVMLSLHSNQLCLIPEIHLHRAIQEEDLRSLVSSGAIVQPVSCQVPVVFVTSAGVAN